jgi:hypothetical protein
MNKQAAIRVGDRFEASDGSAWTVMIVKPFGQYILTTEDFRMQSDFTSRDVRGMTRLSGRNEEIARRMCAA